jgi:hypothetical protein
MIFQITGGSGFFYFQNQRIVGSQSESGNCWFWVLQKHQRPGTLHERTSNGLAGRKVVS